MPPIWERHRPGPSAEVSVSMHHDAAESCYSPTIYSEPLRRAALLNQLKATMTRITNLDARFM